ncbi:tetratricopeptide repeat protein [Nitrospirillum amazonense]|uniref:Tetratricopeptide repeat protein n=1 Tax=Nitrospirillum amazonense TaxID=28077 RepID=A0A560EU79_9PROT|nr:tetratricopeptide repeat protein [Nitrospirillum amazonense]TWB12933.1 tetratricopeptide repeat protein [Nitrospirillum amazonense]
MASLSEVLSTAVAHHEAGRLDDAESLYAAILAQVPDQIDALHLTGVLTLQRAVGAVPADPARVAAGVNLIRRAHAQPDAAAIPDIAANLGRGLSALARAHAMAGARTRALEALLEAHELGLPLTPADRLALADNLSLVQAVTEAEGHYRALLPTGPAGSAEELPARVGLAKLLIARERRAEALSLLDGLPPTESPRTVPNADAHAMAQGLRAELLMTSRPQDAATALVEMERAGGVTADLRHLSGKVLQVQGDIAGARALYAQALALEPGHAAARLAHAEACLRLGAWRDGFADLSWRWMRPTAPRLHGTIPLWERADQDVSGRRLLVWDETELDALPHLARLLPRLRERGAEVIVEVSTGWAALLPTGPGQPLAGIAVATRGTDAVRADLQVPLQELPDRLSLWDAGDFWRGPYLAPPAGIPPQPFAGPGVGVAADTPLSLTPPVPAGMTAVPLAIPAADQPEAWGRLAATLAALDAVALPAGPLAHLAGAMGRPGVVLVPVNADWRWPAGAERTPWYPSLRLVHGAGWPASLNLEAPS